MNRAPARLAALALPFTAAIRFDAVDTARQLVVFGCAAALILAGRALPF